MCSKHGVIADDLTGASDTGAQYAKKGLKTIVVTDLESLHRVKTEADVVVIDTESRGDPAETAYKKVRRAAEAFQTAGIISVYKKIDSTLRGNIGAELDAIMDAWDLDAAILAPAFPANGRITVGGYHLLHQTPVALTEAARGPSNPVTESHLPTLLKRQAKRKIIHLPLPAVADAPALERSIKRIVGEGGGIIVCDAAIQGDLRRIAHAAARLGLGRLLSGSAGLAEELPEALGLIRRRPAVLISGSCSGVTFRQIRRAEEATGNKALILNIQRVLSGEGESQQETERVTRLAKAALTEGRDVLIASSISREDVEKDLRFGIERGMSSAEIGGRVASALAMIAEAIITQRTAGLILTGGATSIAVFKKLNPAGVRVLDEVMPGIPVSQLVGSRFNSLRLITKAGAFGSDDALVICLDRIKERFCPA